ncbi:ABC transporter substrate-binding protein [Variovorax sp. J2L1-78]|uniref:ABC transporter substrate-binding protein n=1 Tax=Variovorax arabinosiphilus TaxID=3053498 RepID=UPI002577D42B|nr:MULTISPECIES: ABC transporter substrate-binding protein [unclassified Variovorax]MDM0122974.1 ABC transporter substrate-binding protein [Variovorax sp. J2L1-78]MDM0132030.1 ABC transporter substrate-binding protein [Variovorax sp. J2L1-63]MDM0235737.1 ABC transporter substrate-binding protein [Variovorax sp. J2R1-6]
MLAAPAHAQDIKVGFNADQSGTAVAELGIAARHGFDLAIEDINKAGGVLGRKLVGVIRDDTGAPPKSIQNMTELLDSEKVAAVVGPANSGNALAWLHLPQQRKIPVIVPVATATDITRRYAGEPQNFIYRISMVDREQVALLLAYAVKATKNQKIAFIADSTGFGQQGVKDLTDVLAMHGQKPVAVEKFGPKDTDMTSQLAKIRDAGADTVVVYGLADANAQLLRSMEKINYFPTTLGTWGNMSTPLLNIAGKKLSEHIIFATSTAEDSNPRAVALAARVRERYPQMPTFVAAAQAYDSMMLLAAAIKQAGTTDGAKVAATLDDGVPDTQGIIKLYKKPFSKAEHDALSVSDFNLARWKDGKVVSYADAITKAMTPADLKK